jgi:site-specific DNA-adenine methylase
MVRHPGGKAHLGARIASLMHRHVGKPTFKHYYEPFCGKGSVAMAVSAKHRHLSDTSAPLIHMLKLVQKRVCRGDPLPLPHISFRRYKKLERQRHLFKLPTTSREVRNELAYAGFAWSFDGGWFQGRIWDSNMRRDFGDEFSRGIEQQIKKLSDAHFSRRSYDQVNVQALAPGSVIYLDPPYAQHLGPYTNFQSKRFWKWAEQLGRMGHHVFVSETVAPHTGLWECIMRAPLRVRMYTRVEKLFVYTGRRMQCAGSCDACEGDCTCYTYHIPKKHSN